MKVQTIEQAFQSAGARLQQGDIPAQARQALAEGRKYQVLVTVRQAKQGAVLAIEAAPLTPAESLGAFIRLS